MTREEWQMQQQPTLRSTTLLALDFERWQNVVKYLNSFRTTSMFFNFVRFYVKTFPPLGFSFLLSFYHLVWLPIWAHNEVKLLRFFDNGSMEWRKFFFFWWFDIYVPIFALAAYSALCWARSQSQFHWFYLLVEIVIFITVPTQQ